MITTNPASLVQKRRAETILIVESQEAVREALKSAVEAGAFEVIAVSTGDAALKRLPSADLVLLDITLPHEDGWEICRRIREIRSDLPVIVVTARDDAESVVRGFEAGAVDYVSQPFRQVELLARIECRLQLRRAYQTISASQQWLQSLVSSSEDIIYTADREGRYSAAFGGWLERNGIDTETFVGKQPADVLGPELARVHEDAHARALAGETLVFEYCVPGASGNIHFDTSLSPLRDDLGEVVGTVGISRDITRLRTAEQALRRQALLFASVSDAVFITDLEHRVVEWNRGAERVFGYSPDEVRGQCPCDFLASTDLGGFRRKVQAALDDTGRWEGEVTLRHRDGRAVISEVSITRMHDASGVAIGTLSINRDITDRRKVEAALQMRHAVQEAVGQAAERLLQTSCWRTVGDDLLARLGTATRADRVYIFENQVGPGGEVLTSQRLEWVAHEVSPQIGFRGLQQLDLAAAGYERWVRVLGSGGAVHGQLSDLPTAEQALLQEQGIASLAVVPIFAGQSWWGFLGIDSCSAERGWSSGEIDSLRTAAGLLGSAIQREAADEALRASEARFRFLAELMPQLVWSTTVEGYHDYYNQRWYDFTGMSREGSQGWKWKDFLHPDDVDRTVERWNRSIRTGEPYEIEYRFRQASDGSYRWFIGRALPQRNDDGRIVRWLGTCTDVHDERMLREELQANEARFRLMVEGSEHVFFYEHDVQGCITYISPSVEAVLGYDPEEVVGRSYEHFLTDPAHVEEIHRTTSALLQTGESQGPFVALNRHTDGTTIPLEMVETPVLRDGEVVGVQGLARDISERWRSQERLERAEAHYRRLVEASPSGIFALDRHGCFTEVNAALAEMLECTPSDLLGEPFTSVLAGEDLQTLRALFNDRMVGRIAGVKSYECEFLSRSGQKHVGEIRTVSVLDNGRVVGSHGVVRDITTQRSVEAALRESERRSRTLVENIQDVIALLDAEGRILYLSPAIERITTISPDELIGRSAVDLVHPEDEESARTVLAELGEQPGATRQVELRIRHGDGSWRTVDARGQNLLDDPAMRAIVITFRDVTVQHALEEQLRQAQKMEAVGRLAGGVAHDFNNLLMVIDTNTRFTLEDLPEDSPSREDLEEVRSAAETAASLTQQLLAFSRKQVMRPRPVLLNDIAKGTEKMLRRLIGEDIDLVSVLEPELGMVHADPGQIDQILLNLAVNARDAMPTGGVLRVETANVAVTDVVGAPNPYGVQAGDYVVLSVSDTGHGMDSDTLERIFEPFFTTKEQGKGTGLGLSTVYGIVKQSGGYVWAESEPLKGTTFHVYLPRVLEVQRQEEAERPAQKSGAGQTVLVVEDEVAVRTLTRKVLQRAGYDVLEAADGEEALEVVESHSGTIHLLLTDVVMPRMGGPALVERLSGTRPTLPVLFMSGYTDDAVLRHGAGQAATQFLQKPTSPQRLLQEVERLLAAGQEGQR